MYISCIAGGTRDTPESQFDSKGKALDRVGVDPSVIEGLRNNLSMVAPMELLVQRCEREDATSTVSVFVLAGLLPSVVNCMNTTKLALNCCPPPRSLRRIMRQASRTKHAGKYYI